MAIIDCPGCGRANYSTINKMCDRCGFEGPPPQTGEEQLNGPAPGLNGNGAQLNAPTAQVGGRVVTVLGAVDATKDARIAALEQALDSLGRAARDEEVKALRDALASAVRIAEEALEEWDKAPEGMRAGKILTALAGRLPLYRADITRIHKVLAGAIELTHTHRHKKGKPYVLLGYGLDTETSEEVAIYLDEVGGLFSRPRAMFDELTRFEPIIEAAPAAPVEESVEAVIQKARVPRGRKKAEANGDPR